jgi:hypothetical protein
MVWEEDKCGVLLIVQHWLVSLDLSASQL